MAECVKVVVRCRPMNSRELALKCKSVVVMDSEHSSCSIMNPEDSSAPPKTFTFDGVYSVNSTTEQIYNESAYPLIEGVMEGYNSTIFAYGQTGCGKSFSMQGVADPPPQRGIIPRAFEHIFEAISVESDIKFLVWASYLEIYNEEIRDLLGVDIKKKLDLKECPDRGIYVQELTWHAVGSVADCEELMRKGWSNRATGATLMNADSSRSHSIFSVTVEMMETALAQEDGGLFRKGKLSLVDLAGSERQAKTDEEKNLLSLVPQSIRKIVADLMKRMAGRHQGTLVLSGLGSLERQEWEERRVEKVSSPDRFSRCHRKPPAVFPNGLTGIAISETEDVDDVCVFNAGAQGDRLKEASKINLSLSALGNVISALVDGKAKHIPYRDSKLTRLLQDSLGGNTKTLMLACLSPADNNYDETLSTLRYANRAKNICNKPTINEDPKDAMLRKYQEEIEQLKAMLTTPKMVAVDEVILQQEREKVKLEYEKELEALRNQFKEMHVSKIQVQKEFESLKNQYENQISDINNKSVFKQEPITYVDSGDCKEEGNGTPVANNSENNDSTSKLSQQEVLARLVKLQRTLVGGEKAGDQSVKERRARRKKAAEKKLNALAEILAKEENNGLVLGMYDDMHDQLAARSETLKKYRHKIKSLEREITDLQSEFEVERTDYLETIRKLDRQVELNNQILEKIIPSLKNQYNYSNIEAIKAEARWDEDSQRWIIPDLFQLRTKLPPPGKEGISGEGKLEKSEEEDFAGNYFKPKRATELLIKAQQDAARANNNYIYGNKSFNLQGSLNAINSLASLKTQQNSFLNNSWSGPTTNLNGWIGSQARPVKLEALPVVNRKPSTTKPQLNTLDVI